MNSLKPTKGCLNFVLDTSTTWSEAFSNAWPSDKSCSKLWLLQGDELDRKKTWGVHIVGTSVTISALASVGLNSIKLAEGDGWTVTKGVGSGHAPTQLQMLGILADVSELKIRGNFFRSSEMTHISYVRLLAGTQDVGKLRDRVQKSPLVKAKTPTPQLVGVGILLAPQINNTTKSMSYYVKALQSGSPAHLCHRIHEGDRLLSVDGHFVDGKRLRQIARLIVGEVCTLFSLHVCAKKLRR